MAVPRGPSFGCAGVWPNLPTAFGVDLKYLSVDRVFFPEDMPSLVFFIKRGPSAWPPLYPLHVLLSSSPHLHVFRGTNYGMYSVQLVSGNFFKFLDSLGLWVPLRVGR